MDDTTILKDAGIREAIADTCHHLYERELVSSTGGNVSMRVGDRILITPTGCSLRSVKPDELVLTDLSGKTIGTGKPSKEVYLHSTAYRARPEVRAVIHVHSPCSIALCCRRNCKEGELPSVTPGYVLRVGKLPVVPYNRPGSMELAASIETPIVGHDAVMLQNHGLVAVGVNLEQAVNIAEEVEENAKIYLLAGEEARVLTTREIEDILNHFKK